MIKMIMSFLFITSFFSAQDKKFIDFSQSLKDKKSLTKSLTFIDARENKDIGTVDTKNKSAELHIKQNDLNEYFSQKFLKDNKTLGSNDIVVMLEDLKVKQQPDGKFTTGVYKIKISSFIKRNEKYYFVNRIENVFLVSQTSPNAAFLTAQNISQLINSFIRDSYSHLVLSNPIAENDLKDYENVLLKNAKLFSTEKWPDGAYTSYKKMLDLQPEKGFYAIKNRKGEVVRFKKDQDLDVSNGELYGYTEAGKMYIMTLIGFLEVERDEDGIYIVTSRAEQTPKDNSLIIGATVGGGLIGGLIATAITYSINSRNPDNINLYKVHIDPLTGNLILPK